MSRIYSYDEIMNVLPNGGTLKLISESARWTNGTPYLKWYYDQSMSVVADLENQLGAEEIEEQNRLNVTAIVQAINKTDGSYIRQFFTDAQIGEQFAGTWEVSREPYLLASENDIIASALNALKGGWTGGLLKNSWMLLAGGALLWWFFLRKKR